MSVNPKVVRSLLSLAFALALAFAANPGPATGQPAVPTNFVAHCEGGQEVPERETGATGQAVFQLNADGTELSFKLMVANMENVVQSHIHLGNPGVSGPAVAFLAGPFPPGGGRFDGVLNQGTITAGNLVGPLAGSATLDVLVAALKNGAAYVNVHTDDGIAPANTGAGDFPGGEIRGQVKLAGRR